MIKFFRQIRQKLISSGNYKKYLLYAIGEILLVMIGILLALRVNNWNEAKKLHRYEISSLENIKSDLHKSASNLEICNQLDSVSVDQIDHILEYLKTQNPYNDSLSLHLGNLLHWAKPTFTKSAYETLKSSKGLAIITNDSLRQEIIDVHELGYSFALENIDKEESMIHQELMLPIFAELFVTNENDGAVPIDYNALLHHKKFINVLSLTRRYRASSIAFERRLKNRINDLIRKLDLELNQL